MDFLKVDLQDMEQFGGELKPGVWYPGVTLYKAAVIAQIATRFGARTLIETGTYLGDTLVELYSYFDNLYSIELSEKYYSMAVKRFKQMPKVHLIQGDSASKLFEILPGLASTVLEPKIFWLDAHCSAGDTAGDPNNSPLDAELATIRSRCADPCIVLVDDQWAEWGFDMDAWQKRYPGCTNTRGITTIVFE